MAEEAVPQMAVVGVAAAVAAVVAGSRMEAEEEEGVGVVPKRHMERVQLQERREGLGRTTRRPPAEEEEIKKLVADSLSPATGAQSRWK